MIGASPPMPEELGSSRRILVPAEGQNSGPMAVIDYDEPGEAEPAAKFPNAELVGSRSTNLVHAPHLRDAALWNHTRRRSRSTASFRSPGPYVCVAVTLRSVKVASAPVRFTSNR